MEQYKKNVQTAEMEMRWGEMDPLGHMNNVSYFRYFEESRISWFSKLPITYKPEDQGPILGTINCRFLRPAIYPEIFLLKTSIGKLGDKSFFMWTEMLGKKSEICFAEAEAKMVWIDMRTGHSCKMPTWFRELF